MLTEVNNEASSKQDQLEIARAKSRARTTQVIQTTQGSAEYERNMALTEVVDEDDGYYMVTEEDALHFIDPVNTEGAEALAFQHGRIASNNTTKAQVRGKNRNRTIRLINYIKKDGKVLNESISEETLKMCSNTNYKNFKKQVSETKSNRESINMFETIGGSKSTKSNILDTIDVFATVNNNFFKTIDSNMNGINVEYIRGGIVNLEKTFGSKCVLPDTKISFPSDASHYFYASSQKKIIILQIWWKHIYYVRRIKISKIVAIQSYFRGHTLRYKLYHMISRYYRGRAFVLHLLRIKKNIFNKVFFKIANSAFTKYHQNIRSLVLISRLQKRIRAYLHFKNFNKFQIARTMKMIFDARKATEFLNLKEAIFGDELRQKKCREDTKSLVEILKKKSRTNIFHNLIANIHESSLTKMKYKFFNLFFRKVIQAKKNMLTGISLQQWAKNSALIKQQIENEKLTIQNEKMKTSILIAKIYKVVKKAITMNESCVVEAYKRWKMNYLESALVELKRSLTNLSTKTGTKVVNHMTNEEEEYEEIEEEYEEIVTYVTTKDADGKEIVIEKKEKVPKQKITDNSQVQLQKVKSGKSKSKSPKTKDDSNSNNVNESNNNSTDTNLVQLEKVKSKKKIVEDQEEEEEEEEEVTYETTEVVTTVNNKNGKKSTGENAKRFVFNNADLVPTSSFQINIPKIRLSPEERLAIAEISTFDLEISSNASTVASPKESTVSTFNFNIINDEPVPKLKSKPSRKSSDSKSTQEAQKSKSTKTVEKKEVEEEEEEEYEEIEEEEIITYITTTLPNGQTVVTEQKELRIKKKDLEQGSVVPGNELPAKIVTTTEETTVVDNKLDSKNNIIDTNTNTTSTSTTNIKSNEEKPTVEPKVEEEVIVEKSSEQVNPSTSITDSVKIDNITNVDSTTQGEDGKSSPKKKKIVVKKLLKKKTTTTGEAGAAEDASESPVKVPLKSFGLDAKLLEQVSLDNSKSQSESKQGSSSNIAKVEQDQSSTTNSNGASSTAVQKSEETSKIETNNEGDENTETSSNATGKKKKIIIKKKKTTKVENNSEEGSQEKTETENNQLKSGHEKPKEENIIETTNNNESKQQTDSVNSNNENNSSVAVVKSNSNEGQNEEENEVTESIDSTTTLTKKKKVVIKKKKVIKGGVTTSEEVNEEPIEISTVYQNTSKTEGNSQEEGVVLKSKTKTTTDNLELENDQTLAKDKSKNTTEIDEEEDININNTKTITTTNTINRVNKTIVNETDEEVRVSGEKEQNSSTSTNDKKKEGNSQDDIQDEAIPKSKSGKPRPKELEEDSLTAARSLLTSEELSKLESAYIQDFSQRYIGQRGDFNTVNSFNVQIDKATKVVISSVETFDVYIDKTVKQLVASVETFDVHIDKTPKPLVTSVETFDMQIDKTEKQLVTSVETFDVQIDKTEKKLVASVETFDIQIDKTQKSFTGEIQSFDINIEPTLDNAKKTSKIVKKLVKKVKPSTKQEGESSETTNANVEEKLEAEVEKIGPIVIDLRPKDRLFSLSNFNIELCSPCKSTKGKFLDGDLEQLNLRDSAFSLMAQPRVFRIMEEDMGMNSKKEESKLSSNNQLISIKESPETRVMKKKKNFENEEEEEEYEEEIIEEEVEEVTHHSVTKSHSKIIKNTTNQSENSANKTVVTRQTVIKDYLKEKIANLLITQTAHEIVSSLQMSKFGEMKLSEMKEYYEKLAHSQLFTVKSNLALLKEEGLLEFEDVEEIYELLITQIDKVRIETLKSKIISSKKKQSETASQAIAVAPVEDKESSKSVSESESQLQTQNQSQSQTESTEVVQTGEDNESSTTQTTKVVKKTKVTKVVKKTNKVESSEEVVTNIRKTVSIMSVLMKQNLRLKMVSLRRAVNKWIEGIENKVQVFKSGRKRVTVMTKEENEEIVMMEQTVTVTKKPAPITLYDVVAGYIKRINKSQINRIVKRSFSKWSKYVAEERINDQKKLAKLKKFTSKRMDVLEKVYNAEALKEALDKVFLRLFFRNFTEKVEYFKAKQAQEAKEAEEALAKAKNEESSVATISSMEQSQQQSTNTEVATNEEESETGVTTSTKKVIVKKTTKKVIKKKKTTVTASAETTNTQEITEVDESNNGESQNNNTVAALEPEQPAKIIEAPEETQSTSSPVPETNNIEEESKADSGEAEEGQGTDAKKTKTVKKVVKVVKKKK